jgi:hypothetical protein
VASAAASAVARYRRTSRGRMPQAQHTEQRISSRRLFRAFWEGSATGIDGQKGRQVRHCTWISDQYPRVWDPQDRLIPFFGVPSVTEPGPRCGSREHPPGVPGPTCCWIVPYWESRARVGQQEPSQRVTGSRYRVEPKNASR